MSHWSSGSSAMYWRRLTKEHCKIQLENWTQCKTMEAHPGAREAYSGTVEAHLGEAGVHPEAVQAHPRAVQAHPRAVEVCSDAMEAHHDQRRLAPEVWSSTLDQ